MLKHLLNNLGISQKKKDIAKISSGTLLGQMISVAVLPFVTRIYGASIIGEYTTLAAIVNIISSFSDLGLTYSLMTEKDDSTNSIYSIISTLVVVISIIISILVVLFGMLFRMGSSINIIFKLFFLIVYSITIQQVQVCYTLLNKNKEYNILMKNPIINYGVFAVISIGLGVMGIKTYGYYIAHLCGQIVTLSHMKRKLPTKWFNFNLEEYKSVLKRNKNYLIFQLPSNIIGYIKNQMPVLLIRSLWGVEIVGYYSMAVKVLQMPSAFLANAIGRVFFSDISSMKRENKPIGSYVNNNLKKGMKYAIIPMILMIAFGDVGAVVFFGVDWLPAGTFIQIVAMQYYFMFLNNTVQGLPIILEKQNYTMAFFALQLIGFAIGAFVGKFVFDEIIYGLGIMVIIYIILQIWFFMNMVRFMNTSPREYILYSLMSILVIIVSSIAIRFMANTLGIVDFVYRICNIII